MKDDFYKDMNHKRADDEKPDKTDSKNSNKDGEKQTLSRSARHKNKDNQKEGNPKKNNSAKEKKNKNEDSLTDKIQAYFSSENNQKRKAAFIGTLKGYQSRIKNELKVSKEKLGGIGSQTKTKANAKKKNGDNQGRKLPWILSLLVLIPITLLLAFLIFSNFWPSLDDEIELASSESEETNEAEEENNNTAEFNAELEEQKKEHERRLAEGRNNTSSSEDLEVNYSEEELEALESESRTAIQDKEAGESSSNDQESTEDSDTEENSTESETANEDSQTEDSTNNENTTETNTETNQETETADQETEENQTTNANASHTVTTEDNLYRIAIQYYGDGSSENVQRIREANGISENEISVGQQLIIP